VCALSPASPRTSRWGTDAHAWAVTAVGVGLTRLPEVIASRVTTCTTPTLSGAARPLRGAITADRHTGADAIPARAGTWTVTAITVVYARASHRLTRLGPAGADIMATSALPGCALLRVNAIARALVIDADARSIAAIEVRLARCARHHTAGGAARADPTARARLRRAATWIGVTRTVVARTGTGNGAGTGGEPTRARARAAVLVAGAGHAFGTTDRGAGSSLAGLAVLTVASDAAVDEAEVSLPIEKLLDRWLGDFNAPIGAVPLKETDDDLLALARRAGTMPGLAALGLAALGGRLTETTPGEPREDAEDATSARAVHQGA
jgi:hypothetical protein